MTNIEKLEQETLLCMIRILLAKNLITTLEYNEIVEKMMK